MDPTYMVTQITAAIQTDENLIILLRQAITNNLPILDSGRLTAIMTLLGLS